jgi:hypothetical protein
MGRRSCGTGTLAGCLPSWAALRLPRFRLIPLVAAVLLAASFAAARPEQAPAGGDNPCDSRLIPQKGDPLAYGRRGERCEGLYVLEVAGSADLTLVTFSAATPAFTLKGSDRLHLNWPEVPGTLQTRLRAVSLRRQVYYRMDAIRPKGTDSFEWPADVLVNLNLRSTEVGLVGWVQQTVGEKPIDVYVPLRVGTAPGTPSKGNYVVQVVAGAELAEVYVTLAAVAQNGRDEKHIKRDEPLLYGFYPADRPINVPLPGLPAAGLYRVRLGAVLKTGGSANKSFVFYHPGP